MADGKRTIIVTGANEIKTGTSSKGGKWTLTGIDATTESGDPIDLKMKTFDNLPQGQPIEVEIEKQEHDKYGTSYLLKRPKKEGSGNGLGGAVDDLRERVEVLEAKVAALAGGQTPAPSPGSQTEGKSMTQRRRPADGPPPAAPPANAYADDDIPF